MDDYRVRFRVIVTGDAVVRAPNEKKAWNNMVEHIQEIVNREYDDQHSGLENCDEGLFYGLTLRLPSSIVVTGIDIAPGEDDDDYGVDRDLAPPEEGRGPSLRVIKGGKPTSTG